MPSTCVTVFTNFDFFTIGFFVSLSKALGSKGLTLEEINIPNYHGWSLSSTVTNYCWGSPFCMATELTAAAIGQNRAET